MIPAVMLSLSKEVNPLQAAAIYSLNLNGGKWQKNDKTHLSDLTLQLILVQLDAVLRDGGEGKKNKTGGSMRN